MTTVADLAAEVRRPAASGKANKASPAISEGLTPKPLRIKKEGVYILTPEETLSLGMPVLSSGLTIEGYQRNPLKTQEHIRKMARALGCGVIFPTATVALDEDGSLQLTDGGHRALAHVMSGQPFRVEVRKMNIEEQRELFHHQTFGKKLKGDQSVLTGDTPLAEYVQDVFTAPETPWAGLIHYPPKSGYLSPASLELLAGMFGAGKLINSGEAKALREGFNPKEADRLAGLIRAFGTPKTNPQAFASVPRRAIVEAAVLILLRNDTARAGDDARWMTHMPRFDFSLWLHLRASRALRMELIRHWNKRLPAERKVEVQ